jgi:hypothetical protein
MNSNPALDTYPIFFGSYISFAQTQRGQGPGTNSMVRKIALVFIIFGKNNTVLYSGTYKDA